VAKGRFKVIGHTAEVALELAGPDWPAFYEAASAGLAALYGVVPEPKAVEKRTIKLEADGPESLLVAWLNELIYLVGTKRWGWASVEVKQASDQYLEAALEGEALKGVPIREIKAATFGDLSVRKTKAGLKTLVILDV